MIHQRSAQERLEIFTVLKNMVLSAENSRAKEEMAILPGKSNLLKTKLEVEGKYEITQLWHLKHTAHFPVNQAATSEAFLITTVLSRDGLD